MSNAKEEKDINVDGLHFGHESVQSQPVMPVRNYKDTVFRMLFSDKEELLVLYNAVNGTNYTDPDALEITTLESAHRLPEGLFCPGNSSEFPGL